MLDHNMVILCYNGLGIAEIAPRASPLLEFRGVQERLGEMTGGGLMAIKVS